MFSTKKSGNAVNHLINEKHLLDMNRRRMFFYFGRWGYWEVGSGKWEVGSEKN